MRIFYGPAQLFIFHPERANLMAVGFAILFVVSCVRSRKFKPGMHLGILLTTFLWMAFGLNEIRAQQQGWDIRVDLLFFWPALVGVSLATAWFGIRDVAARKPDDAAARQMPGGPSPRVR